jgi:hypothetical protein
LRIYEIDQSSGAVVAATTVRYQVVVGPVVTPTIPPLPPETRTITISSPNPGSQVTSSPVVVTGSTNYYPFEGNLTYQVVNNTGQQIGTGAISVQGAMGGPTTFSAPVVFNLPATPGTVTVRVYERDQGTGEIVASASLTIQALP